MTPTTHLRQTDALQHLDHSLALELVQGLHRHLAPRALLEVLWNQAASLTGAAGMHYRYAPHALDLAFGGGPHSTSYSLSHHGEPLGELELRFSQRIDEAALRKAEDLLTLAIPALRNALTHQGVCRQAARLSSLQPEPLQARAPASAEVVTLHPPSPVTAPEPPARAQPAAASAPTPAPAWEDALVLVALDGYDDVRLAHGDVWAQTLTQTIQSQIHEGLRDSDSVFQIDEGLLAVLLPRTSEDAAIDVAGKIRVLIAGLHLREGRITSQLTACMGVVGARAAHTPEDVLFQARAALAQAQQEGPSTIRAYRLLSSPPA